MADDLTPNADTPATPATDAQPERIDATAALESLSAPERDEWRKSGDLPERIEVDTTPESTPAKAEPRPLSKRQQEINEHVRARTAAELKVKALEAQLAQRAEPRARAPEPDPAPDTRARTKAQEPLAEDREPTIDDFMGEDDPYLALGRAYAKWEVRQVLKADRAEAQTRREAEQADAEVQRIFSEYQTREAALKLQHPDFDAKTQAVRHAINLTTPLGRATVESPVAPQLILHFADHPDDFERIGRLGLTNAPAALRELGKLEARLEAALPPASAAEAPPPLTAAPRPPTTLGSRSAETADDVETAVKRRDFDSYRRAQNARDLAASRK